MTPELAYFLKINVGIALFYAFYRLFLLSLIHIYPSFRHPHPIKYVFYSNKKVIIVDSEGNIYAITPQGLSLIHI